MEPERIKILRLTYLVLLSIIILIIGIPNLAESQKKKPLDSKKIVVGQLPKDQTTNMKLHNRWLKAECEGNLCKYDLRCQTANRTTMSECINNKFLLYINYPAPAQNPVGTTKTDMDIVGKVITLYRSRFRGPATKPKEPEQCIMIDICNALEERIIDGWTPKIEEICEIPVEPLTKILCEKIAHLVNPTTNQK